MMKWILLQIFCCVLCLPTGCERTSESAGDAGAPAVTAEQMAADDTGGESGSQSSNASGQDNVAKADAMGENINSTDDQATVAGEYNALNEKEAAVILHKGTEYAWTGEYTDNKSKGTYICRRCNAALYHSGAKFNSNCGWPSFDDEIEGAVVRLPDADGFRTEIVCANCDGHLGHVFLGEGFTEKNTRHCVNSISMKFVAAGEKLPPRIVADEGTDGESDEGAAGE